MSPLLSSCLVKKIAFAIQKNPILIDCQSGESTQKDIHALCEISLLGQSACYCIKNIHCLPATAQASLRLFIAAYAGPHHLIFFDDAKPNKKNSGLVFLSFDDSANEITYENYHTVRRFFFPEQPAHADTFVKKIFERSKQISLDVAYILFHYQAVLGQQHDQFFDRWFNHIVPPIYSLFTLGTHFFSKNIGVFGDLWQQISPGYVEEFWIAYWSDQLWNAHAYICEMRLRAEKGLSQPPAKSYRLPFSFLQRDWKSYTSEELENAHTFLYDLDYKFKNGSSGSAGVDLFCSKFIHGQFATPKIKKLR